MHNIRPVTRLPFGAAPGFRPGLRAFSILMMGAVVLCITALAAPPVARQAANEPSAAAQANGYVGSETCATCHQDVSKGFANNPHTKMVLMHGGAGITCENCHGAGKAHVEGGGDPTKIFDPAKATPAQVNASCLKCHAASHPNFDRSPHQKAGLSCISCHSVHGGEAQIPGHAAEKAVLNSIKANVSTPTPDYRAELLKAPQPQLCYQCHGTEKAQFDMPMHHPVNEGVVKCSDCHNVHGSFLPNNLKSNADQSAVCTKCHTDVRGPFVYEHAPVKGEGCLACHSPHGSQNARLLNMPNVNVLCNQCHSQVAADTVHGVGSGSTDSVPCTSCHTFIHGSNINQAFLR